MTDKQTQELKALMCPDGCGKNCRLKTVEGLLFHRDGYGGEFPCTASPAVIEWVDKQLDAEREYEREECLNTFNDAHKQAIAAAEEATVEKCAEVIQSMASDIRDGNADASDIEETIRALVKTPGIVATREHQAVLRGQVLGVEMAIANIKNRNLGLLSHEFEKAVNDFEADVIASFLKNGGLEKIVSETREAEIRRQERKATLDAILSKKRDLYEIGSRESNAIQFVINCQAELTAPPTAGSDGAE